MFSLTYKNISNINKLQKITTSNSVVVIRNCSVIDNTPKDEKEGNSICDYILCEK